MSKKNVAANALQYIFTLIKGTFATQDSVPTKTSELSNDSGYVTENTTYSLSKTGGTVTLSGSDGSKSTVSDANTEYSDATATTHGLMSTADKSKLDGIATGANKTTVDSSLSTTSANPVQNKAVKAALDLKAPLASPALTGTPTAPTAADGTSTAQVATTEFVATAVANAMSGITGIDFQVVASLPATGAKGVIYLVSNGGDNNNVYDEYIYVNSSYEKIGTTDVDLSSYLLEADLVELTNSEIDAIWAAA